MRVDKIAYRAPAARRAKSRPGSCLTATCIACASSRLGIRQCECAGCLGSEVYTSCKGPQEGGRAAVTPW